MAKSAQKRLSNSGKPHGTSMLASDHSYMKEMECQQMVEEEFPPLPVTPSKPPVAKKPTLSTSHSDGDSLKADAVNTLINLINTRSDAIEEMVGTVRTVLKDISDKIMVIEKRVEKNEMLTQKCDERISEVERYNRRWNLRLYGVPELEKEDVRAKAIEICQTVLPAEKEKLPEVLDIAHRVGKPKQNDPRPRGIIIRFISRRIRDAVWKAAKNNTFLQNNHLRFTEDLTREDKENRLKLWPIIKKAREEGKSAYFVGGRGFVNGAEIHT
ncbi:unnamed protein product [Oreochromis niloticus]|nr:unnamed protein product [Mustela putorius furo]